MQGRAQAHAGPSARTRPGPCAGNQSGDAGDAADEFHPGFAGDASDAGHACWGIDPRRSGDSRRARNSPGPIDSINSDAAGGARGA